MSEFETSTQMERETPTPNPDLKSLERLVGAWRQTGGVEGQVTYEWAEGGFFLIQRVELEQYGHVIRGFEVIGHWQEFGQEPDPEIKSRFYSYLDGLTLDYVYEVEGDTVTIWGGMKGSPAYYKGTFSPDGNTLTGDWVYPGGGGYHSVATRVK